MTYQQGYKYTNKLQIFVESYNNTYQRTIGMAPKSVNSGNETAVLWRMNWPRNRTRIKKTKTVSKPFRFKIGDYVRLTHLRNPFSREYDKRWTGEILVISQRIFRGGLILIKDEIKGTFYHSELQKVDVKDNDLWKVEKKLKDQRKGKKQTIFCQMASLSKEIQFLD